MLKNYFSDFVKKSAKKTASKKNASAKNTSSADQKINITALIGKIRGIIPLNLEVESLKPVDSSGFSPEGADYIIFKKYCRDIATLMNGYIPYELIHGGLFIVDDLAKTTLADALNRVAALKKINKFAESENTFSVPCFIFADCTREYPLLDLKNDVSNYYLSKGFETDSEFDLLAIHNFGILIKDWHSGKRSFVALETGEDTLMWFVILMNEYLDIERDGEFDLRRYVKGEKTYNEF